MGRSSSSEKRNWSPNRHRTGYLKPPGSTVAGADAHPPSLPVGSLVPQDLNLPKRQRQLFDALLGRGDVSWQDLCAAIEAEPTGHLAQYLGPYITKLNRRLAKANLRVEPGLTKGTYRLTAI